MGSDMFSDLEQGLEQAIEHARGASEAHAEHHIHAVDIKALRKRLGMTQERFAAAFGVSAATVRNWEQGRRAPRGPARALLRVIQREPEAVLRALDAA